MIVMGPKISCFFFFFLAIVIVCTNLRSWALPQNKTVCDLDFNAHPFVPVGECNGNGNDRKVTVWDGVGATECCRNTLNAVSQALALRTSETKEIFLTESQWQNCTFLFSRKSSGSIDSCGFDMLNQNNGKCSELNLSSFESNYKVAYNSALGNCSQFQVPSFDDQCVKCTKAIADLIDYVKSDLQVNGNSEGEEMCSIATVIAIASREIRNTTWIDDFYRCLPAMDIDTEDHLYLKIKRTLAKGILATFVAIMGLILLIIVVKFVVKKSDDEPVKGKSSSAWPGLYAFTKAEIEKAINYGNSKVCLGSGSAGRVFQGVLPSGQLVAIKHIYKTAMSGSFTREMERLSKIRHPNLVTLFGYCIEEDEQYLVYEYCPNGNLAHNLLRSDSVLPWDKRVKILRDCALALRFLHTHPDGCIVHRDIKLTNILLMENMEPKLSDFGLAKMIGMEETRVFTDVRGTIGYMDPEYLTNAKLSCSSDIYSFGIVALQILSGRKVIELDIEARDTLTKKAKDVAMGKRPIQDFIDTRLKDSLNLRDFESLLHVAVLCVANSSKGRPTIHDLFGELNKAWSNTVANMPALGRRDSYTVSTSEYQSADGFEI